MVKCEFRLYGLTEKGQWDNFMKIQEFSRAEADTIHKRIQCFKEQKDRLQVRNRNVVEGESESKATFSHSETEDSKES